MDSVWRCRGEWLHRAVTQNTLSLHITRQGLSALCCSPPLCRASVCARDAGRASVWLTHLNFSVCDSMCVCVHVCVSVWVREGDKTERVFGPHWQTMCNRPSLWPDVLLLLGASTLASSILNILCVSVCVCKREQERETFCGLCLWKSKTPRFLS